MKRMFTLSALLLFVLITQAQFRYFQTVLSGANEVPPNGSSGSGVVLVKYNTATNSLTLIGDYMGLSANAVMAHIHQAPAGVNGPVIVPLMQTGGMAGTLSGTGTVNDAQEAALLAGNMYVNVHSTMYPGGEVRGQLMPTTDGQTDFLNARMQGAQEVPPNPSMAMGSTFVLLDRGTNTVYVTGRYAGLSANITGSHIHTGLPGFTGPIIVPFTNSGGTAGVMHAVVLLNDAQETAMSTGATYSNVHSSVYPGGEIRGQVTHLSQERFFAASLSGDQQVPPVITPGKGTAIVRYNPETHMLDLVGDYQNLSAEAMMAHIHLAPAGSNGSVIVPLTITNGTSGTLTGSGMLTDAQEAALYAGNMYVNVHNANHPGGEIRGQLMATTVGKTHFLVGKLQGLQETPPNNSPGTGLAAALLDAATGKVYVTASYSGLTGNAMMAHIHQAPPKTAGPVILPLSITMNSASGTVTGNGMLSPAQVNAMINGNTYVNVHTAMYPGGELRAQLGNLVLQEPDMQTWYRDWDKDGYGDPARMVMDIIQPAGYVANNLDCNDYRVYYEDKDNDGWGSSVKLPCGTITRTGDCDDNNRRVHSPQTFYRDADGDSWGDPNTSIQVCTSVAPEGYVANRMDCNDNDKMIRYCPPASVTMGTNPGRRTLEEQAAAFVLSATPNPFVQQTRIQYQVPVDARVSLKLFDVLGREVSTLFQGQRSAGTYTQEYNAAKLASGVYYLRMVATAGGKAIEVQAQKLVKAE